METMLASEWVKIAEDGGIYAPWFRAMGSLQRAIDSNQDDAAEGMSMDEQIDALEDRIKASIRILRSAASRVPPSGAF